MKKVLLITAVFVVPFLANAASTVSGDITTDTTWTKAQNPYIINDSTLVNVLDGATLTIEPGVIVKFGEFANLGVFQGKLLAVGLPDDKIYFTSLKNDAISGDDNGDGDLSEPSAFDDWGMSLHESVSTGFIENTVFSFVGYPLSIQNSSLIIRDSLITDTLGAVGVYGGDNLFLERVKIIDPLEFGLLASGGQVSINNSEIEGIINSSVILMNSGKLFLLNSTVTGSVIGTALNLFNSSSTIINSSISGGQYGISFWADDEQSSLIIENSAIEDFLMSGLVVMNAGEVSVSNSTFRNNHDGILVFEFLPNPPIDLTLVNNAIYDNDDYGLLVFSSTIKDARNNWWGDPSGPQHPILNPFGLGNAVSDNILLEPWLTSDPTQTPTCCSSVVFIPGLEASRLYTQETIFENQLWEPNINNDVKVLALDPITGESLNTGIYTEDVIDEAFSINIYKNFLVFMENMVTAGDIADFETFPYDWRFDVKDVVDRSVTLRNSSYEMIPKLREIATVSQTGKVTIIAHSNGGLVAKELLNKLEETGEENLVDRIILVATPELGTPKAVLEMLHGMEPFILNFPRKEVTRELAENMKSAYALLPSAEYFNRLGVGARPIIEFSTTTAVTASPRGIYGSTISNYENLRKFILGDNGGRTEPSATAINLPNVLKEPFLAGAETRHSELDSWQPPTGIDTVEIVGWGLETPRGIVYKSKRQNVCNADLSVCAIEEVIDPEPLSTAEGDGTVVYLSADALGGERYYVNLRRYNALGEFNINRKHKNILEVSTLEGLISTLIMKEATTTLPEYITNTKPETTSIAERLKINVHSPVDLNLYDSLDRHTGPIPNPDPLSDLELSEEQIPNSYYWQLGEGQYAGAGGEATTTIKLVGTALGSVTVGIERVIGDETIIASTLFEDVPITAGGLAVVDVIPNAEPIMLLDVDGDGIVDAEISPAGLSSEDLIAILKGLIKTLDLPNKKEKQLNKVIDKFEKELAKEQKKTKGEKLKTKPAFKKLIKLISQYQKKGILSAIEVSELISMIEEIRSKVVE